MANFLIHMQELENEYKQALNTVGQASLPAISPDQLEIKVDLVEKGGLKPGVSDLVLKEAILV